ncbi:MAG: hypothetical protein U1G08_21090 [Verrucomicrobiota bacterium]
MATVFGTIVYPDRAPFQGRVGFVPFEGAPVGLGASTVAFGSVVANCSVSGFFTTEIVAGRYWVHVGNALRRLITVADDNKAYLLQDLLGGTPTGISPQNFRFVTEGIQFIHAVTGAFHSLGIVGAPDALDWAVYEAGDVLTPGSYKVVGTTAFFRAAENGAWHAPFLTGPNDAPVMNFGAANAEIPGGNFNLSATRWQLRNVDTGLYHTFFVVGDPGAEAWAIGPGE